MAQNLGNSLEIANLGQNPNTDKTGFINLGNLRQKSDVAFALGLMCVLVVMIMPMPKALMDFSLAISIAFSILILMTALFIEKPLDFSSFPTILLVSTMMRLSLNVATTRLILSQGHEGTSAAGKVIEAFGHFIMQGNFVIGIIVFAILVIVNFVVITKGSGRIAEVSARFSLDAMPGKQMAIDADLAAGLINENEARQRRKNLELESNFFGSMDGAAKFVRGDAIAGLLITFINIIGGIIIGVVQMNLQLGDAVETYTTLTVGDGLVTQIPALIVSTAAGMLVSKAGAEGSMDKALIAQLSAYPNALGLCSFVMLIMALLPGIPFIPFTLLASATGFGAFYIAKNQEKMKQAIADKQTDVIEPTAQESENQAISNALQIDNIRIELGYGLISLINTEEGLKLTQQIKALRKQMASEVGFVLPSVRILDNLSLSPNEYCIYVKDLEAGRGQIKANMLLVMDPNGQPISLAGEMTTEPTFGLPAMWVPPSLQADAEKRGYTVVDSTTVLTTHLTEVVRDNMSELLTYADTQDMLNSLNENYKKLLNDMVPNQITVGGIQRVLQNLISERISIRDLAGILEGISEACTLSRNISIITEHVRQRLNRQITFANTHGDLVLNVVTLSPKWEEIFMNALVGEGEIKQLALAPSELQEFISNFRKIFDKIGLLGDSAVLVTSAQIRPYARSIIERVRSATVVMSQNEIHPKAKIKSLGQI